MNALDYWSARYKVTDCTEHRRAQVFGRSGVLRIRWRHTVWPLLSLLGLLLAELWREQTCGHAPPVSQPRGHSNQGIKICSTFIHANGYEIIVNFEVSVFMKVGMADTLVTSDIEPDLLSFNRQDFTKLRHMYTWASVLSLILNL